MCRVLLAITAMFLEPSVATVTSWVCVVLDPGTDW